MKLKYITILILVFLLSGCDVSDNSGEPDPDIFEYDFSDSEASWEPFFTDYNVGWGEKMNLTSDYRPLPEPLNTDDYAHFISAVNHSDDVKMLFRKQVEGLEPNTLYQVDFIVRFGTSVPSDCAGIGGAPGEAVWVIADVSAIKPEPFIGGENDDYYLLNIQHLDDPNEWHEDVMMGNIANSRECDDGYEYEIKEISSVPNHRSVISDDNGQAWLMFGTRSGFEGQTDLYYTYFKAEFRP